jgi:hypothetical protein
MSFETVSLLLSWLELGALLAILARLARTFELIASTQRELRRAIHHLGEHRANELGVNGVFRGAGIPLGSGSPPAHDDTGSTGVPADQARLSHAINP